MKYTLGVALLMLSSGEASSMWRLSAPERVVTKSTKGLEVTEDGVTSMYLATEDEEAAMDWLIGSS